MKELDCAGLIDVAPELAAGSLCGEERAAAFAHLAHCPACQEEVNALAAVTDRLLLLTPVVEPPVGFERRVLAVLDGERVPARRDVRVHTRSVPKLIAAAALVLALVTGGLLVDAARPSDSVNVRAEMRTADGDVVGHAYLHEPALLVVAMQGWRNEAEQYGARDGSYTLHVAIGGGREMIYVVGLEREPIWSASLGEPVESVRRVSVVDAHGRVLCEAQFD